IYMSNAATTFWSMYFVVRTQRDPLSVAESARACIGRVDPDLPVNQIMPLDQSLAERIAGIRLGASMMAAFAAAALLLSVIGIHGVIAYLANQRQPETGVRTALGAESRRIPSLIMARGGRLVLIGLAIGLPGSMGAVRLLKVAISDLIDDDAIVFVVFTFVVV